MKKLLLAFLILGSLKSFSQELISFRYADQYEYNTDYRSIGAFRMDEADQYDFAYEKLGDYIKIEEQSILIKFKSGESWNFKLEDRSVKRVIKENIKTEIETIIATRTNDKTHAKIILRRINSSINQIQIETLKVKSTKKDYEGNNRVYYMYLTIIDKFE